MSGDVTKGISDVVRAIGHVKDSSAERTVRESRGDWSFLEDSELVDGGAPIDVVVSEWVERFGDRPEVAKRWLEVARCADPASALDLMEAGITPEMAAETAGYGEGTGDYSDTVGCKYSHGDITLEDAKRIAGDAKAAVTERRRAARASGRRGEAASPGMSFTMLDSGVKMEHDPSRGAFWVYDGENSVALDAEQAAQLERVMADSLFGADSFSERLGEISAEWDGDVMTLRDVPGYGSSVVDIPGEDLDVAADFLMHAGEAAKESEGDDAKELVESLHVSDTAPDDFVTVTADTDEEYAVLADIADSIPFADTYPAERSVEIYVDVGGDPEAAIETVKALLAADAPSLNVESLSFSAEAQVDRGDSPADRHQCRIAVDTVRNPDKALAGGPSPEEAEETLRTKFGYSEEDIARLKGESRKLKTESTSLTEGTALSIKAWEGQDVPSVEDVVAAINQKFTDMGIMGNVEQMGMRLDDVIADVAQEMGAALDYDDEGDAVLDFTGVSRRGESRKRIAEDDDPIKFVPGGPDADGGPWPASAVNVKVDNAATALDAVQEIMKALNPAPGASLSDFGYDSEDDAFSFSVVSPRDSLGDVVAAARYVLSGTPHEIKESRDAELAGRIEGLSRAFREAKGDCSARQALAKRLTFIATSGIVPDERAEELKAIADELEALDTMDVEFDEPEASPEVGPGGHEPDGSGPPEHGRGAGPGGGREDGSGMDAELADIESRVRKWCEENNVWVVPSREESRKFRSVRKAREAAGDEIKAEPVAVSYSHKAYVYMAYGFEPSDEDKLKDAILDPSELDSAKNIHAVYPSVRQPGVFYLVTGVEYNRRDTEKVRNALADQLKAVGLELSVNDLFVESVGSGGVPVDGVFAALGVKRLAEAWFDDDSSTDEPDDDYDVDDREEPEFEPDDDYDVDDREEPEEPEDLVPDWQPGDAVVVDFGSGPFDATVADGDEDRPYRSEHDMWGEETVTVYLIRVEDEETEEIEEYYVAASLLR